MTYQLHEGGSEVLDVDEGKIDVVIPDGARCGDVTMVIIEKRIVLKPGNSLAMLFHLNPDGLGEMLRFWVLQAHKYCQLSGAGSP